MKMTKSVQRLANRFQLTNELRTKNEIAEVVQFYCIQSFVVK